MYKDGISVLILAAGNSERMGRSKAGLPYGNGLTFAGHLVSQYLQSGFTSLILVVNEHFGAAIPEQERVKFVLNHHIHRGRSWSLRLGAQQIPAGHACFIQNIDNPFADADLLEQMCSVIKPNCYVVPVFEGRGGHPVLLGNQVVDQLRGMGDDPDLRMLPEISERVEIAAADNRILLNINTPEAFQEFISGKVVLP